MLHVDQEIAVYKFAANARVIQKCSELLADTAEYPASDFHSNTKHAQKELQQKTDDNGTPTYLKDSTLHCLIIFIALFEVITAKLHEDDLRSP